MVVWFCALGQSTMKCVVDICLPQGEAEKEYGKDQRQDVASVT